MYENTVRPDIKKANRTNIFSLLRKGNALTKQEMMSALNLSLPTVTQNIAELVELGVVKQSGFAANTGGRNAVTYTVNESAAFSIGLEITKRHVTAVVVDTMGKVLFVKRRRRAFEKTDEYMKALGDICNDTIEVSGVDKEKILGVGIGLPGLVTEDNRNIFYGKILDVTDTTCEELSKYIPFETRLFNDANAAGFAELWAAGNHGSAFYLLLSNNVGGSVLIDGKVYHGDDYRSGEIGHMTIVPDGCECYCGQRGCVDAYCAATVLSADYDGYLETFFRALDDNDDSACAKWNEYVKHLAITVNNIRALFDCRVIIGGYVGGLIEKRINDVRSAVLSRSSFDTSAEYISECLYKVESIAAGAALPFINDYLDSI